MDLDELERLAQDNVDDGVSVDFSRGVLTLIARVRAAEAERDRLRALFDEAGQGEHDVLALVDYYQEKAGRAYRSGMTHGIERALQAAADVVYQALTCDMPVGIAAAILALSADEIDAFAEQQAKAHGAEPKPIPPEYITTGCGPGRRIMGEAERRVVDEQRGADRMARAMIAALYWRAGRLRLLAQRRRTRTLGRRDRQEACAEYEAVRAAAAALEACL